MVAIRSYRLAAFRTAGKRRDIQGLRAVAVLLVALNHAGLSWLGGGYVGVDVFFVVSGYLITGGLLKGSRREGAVPLKDFYARRARRILPMAAIVLAATTIAARYLLNYIRAQDIVHDTVWAAFFSANIRFAHLGTDYFARDQPASPIQHFWSLAVEEQFYVVWPVLLGLILFGLFWRQTNRPSRAGRGEEAPLATGRVGIALIIIIIGTLGWCWRETSTSQVTAYFSTVARAWELGIGALLAVCESRLSRVPHGLRALLTWAGLAAIMVAALSYNDGTKFPGLAATIPVIGTALIIAAGVRDDAPRFGATMLLNRAPLQLVGNVSYSLYLWHWPLLILPEQHVGHPLAQGSRLLLLGAALLLSIFSYSIVEYPLMYGRLSHPKTPTTPLLLWPATVVAILVVAVWESSSITTQINSRQASSEAAISNAVTSTSSASPAGSTGNSVAAAVAAAVSNSQIPPILHPDLRDLSSDVFNLGDCSAHAGQGTTSSICHYGDKASATTVVVFGDSHAQMWMPAFVAAATARHWDVIPLIKEGCTLPTWWGADNAPACKAWHSWALGQAERLHPDAIVVSTSYGKAQTDTAWAQPAGAAMAQTLDRLSAVTNRLAVFEDVPSIPKQPVDCLLADGATTGTCTFRIPPSFPLADAAVAHAADAAGATFIKTEPWVCWNNACPLIVGDVVTRMDQGHVSATYARQIAPVIRRQLARIV